MSLHDDQGQWPLQFGAPETGAHYADRPAAFGVAVQEGRIACVRVSREGEAPYLDLPGGAIDPGENAEAAVAREFGEETGLVITPVAAFARAAQFMRMVDGQAVNNLCVFFEVTVEATDPTLRIESDHALEWRDPFELIEKLRHEAHAWAVAAWSRRHAGASPKF